MNARWNPGIAVAAILLIVTSCSGKVEPSTEQPPSANAPAASPAQPKSAVVYTNKEYGFTFSLPDSWKGYSIVNGTWNGRPVDAQSSLKPETGPLLSIRHPLWTKENPRQDIPIMIFTMAQWQEVQKEQIAVSAAPIPPAEIGRNAKYVFATPPRFEFAYPTGWQEVVDLLKTHPLQPI